MIWVDYDGREYAALKVGSGVLLHDGRTIKSAPINKHRMEWYRRVRNWVPEIIAFCDQNGVVIDDTSIAWPGGSTGYSGNPVLSMMAVLADEIFEAGSWPATDDEKVLKIMNRVDEAVLRGFRVKSLHVSPTSVTINGKNYPATGNTFVSLVSCILK